ncbi:hypothetical protein ACFIJ5_11460 [Haloimpatiens sp. FM7330]|uniref:hypothetical protein n=1 Tax=Haloimpatiens sp. FM7330 TaxID=3298610 RepID=UPI003624C5E3
MSLFLIIIGVLLILINVRTIKKEKNNFKSTYDFKKENLKDYQLEIGKLRSELSETILEIQKEIEYLKTEVENKKNTSENLETKDVEIQVDNSINRRHIDEIIEDDKDIKHNDKKDDLEISNKSVKVLEVDKLLQEGVSIDEISEKLDIGKGEVLLIKELYAK